MAKPIEPTPTLRGKEAVAFLKDFLREQKHPSKARLKFLRRARKARFNFDWKSLDPTTWE